MKMLSLLPGLTPVSDTKLRTHTIVQESFGDNMAQTPLDPLPGPPVTFNDLPDEVGEVQLG